MNNRIALDPKHSVVVEACAGSGKTWLLVSRIVRLLLDGVKPGEILAITFTRKAAQEMQARLHEWLHLLAVQDDDRVREFLRERALDDIDDAMLARARGLYRDILLAQPAITISTFHGWFMQIIQRAPLNAGVPVGMQLLERTSALRDEAWQSFADSLRAAPDGETAQFMQWLFTGYGLYGARSLLENFVHKRAEWWAYTAALSPSRLRPPRSALPASGRGERDSVGEGPVAWAVEQLHSELEVDPDADPVADACTDVSLQAAVLSFAQVLATGTETQCNHAGKLQAAWEVSDPRQRFAALSLALYTQADEPRSFKPTKNQNAENFLFARDVLFDKLQAVRDALTEREVLRMNQAALHCGAALLEHYQELKLRAQQMDFTDLEWQVCRMLNQSDCAEYMQYKLDSRYRHVLLDEFQDTNPLQWQILQAWFAASAAVDSLPTVFVVGDPKQSIYRFRRADARLFGVVRGFLEREFGAHHLTQNETRRNAPAVLDAVNGVFSGHPDGFMEFEEHVAHHQDLPGHVEVLPLAEQLPSPASPHPNLLDETTSHSTRLPKTAAKPLVIPPAGEGTNVSPLFERGEDKEHEELNLRNPLTTPRAEQQDGAREIEAEQFAAHIAGIVANWSVQDDGKLRRAEYRDIMVLVRARTHLRVYEHALRNRHIPFLTSRRGGLLDTLEAEDIQALLTFLITPFADLELAQALRSPLFACSDEDLMRLAEIPPSPPFHPQGVRRGVPDASGITLSQAKGGESVGSGKSSADGIFSVPPFAKGGLGGICSWWQRLQHLADPSPALQRAAGLLQRWLALADKLPVHDLLDRIYFEGDLLHRYAAALPAELHETVRANLQAFMEIALNVDAGRYPSLPRFLAELRELRTAENESPDEGKVGEAGNALRIYTVHEAKGLEAPIVWLLDANDIQRKADSYGVLLDWPPNAPRPAHFSLYTDKRGRGVRRAPYFAADEAYAQREEMNLLYVAMTRAKQALLVSGNGEPAETSWYGRIAAVVGEKTNPLGRSGSVGAASAANSNRQQAGSYDETLLTQHIPTGKRAARNTLQQQRGIWLHALLQHLAPSSPDETTSHSTGETTSHPTKQPKDGCQVVGYKPASGQVAGYLPQAGRAERGGRSRLGERDVDRRVELQQRLSISSAEIDTLWQQAQRLLASPQLARFFDARQYRSACNEMPYVNAAGELKRIDRMVEFDDEVWVLDYKLGDSEDAARHQAQMQEYRTAMQTVYAGKTVRSALILGDGQLLES